MKNMKREKRGYEKGIGGENREDKCELLNYKTDSFLVAHTIIPAHTIVDSFNDLHQLRTTLKCLSKKRRIVRKRVWKCARGMRSVVSIF